jgi:hypothetical protein
VKDCAASGAALHRLVAKTRVSRNLPRLIFQLDTERSESRPESCVFCGCWCNQAWVLKNSLSRNSQNLHRVRML